jgi:hypothetical protein
MDLSQKETFAKMNSPTTEMRSQSIDSVGIQDEEEEEEPRDSSLVR